MNDPTNHGYGNLGPRRAWGLRLACVAALLGAATGCGAPATDLPERTGETEQALVPQPIWAAVSGLTDAQYQADFNTKVQAGYRLTYVSGYEQSGQPRYNALWEKGTSTNAWSATHGVTLAQFQATAAQQVTNGFQIVLVNAYSVGGQALFAAIWEKRATPVPQVATPNLTATQLQDQFNTLPQQGYRIVHMSGYTSAGAERYASIWEQKASPFWFAIFGADSAGYQQNSDDAIRDGYHLVDVQGYAVGGQARYTAIFEQSPSGALAAFHGASAATYNQQFADYRYQGYRPLVVSGYNVAGTPQFAALFKNDGFTSADFNALDAAVQAFQTKHPKSGGSIAVARGGRLVYARAFGTADRATNAQVNTSSLFRIASISKPLTSTAIMKLVEQGKLSLSDKVFGNPDPTTHKATVLGTFYGAEPYGSTQNNTWVKSIRVQDLLDHAAGGWSNNGSDPMFTTSTITQEQVIKNALTGQALVSQPGTQYAYSNFGYCVLGRIIEKVSGQSYSAFVKSAVLTPSGITDMSLGKTVARASNEVDYYVDDGVAADLNQAHNTTTLNVERMDSHGGWIATPIDLVRFGVHVDKRAAPTDVLSKTNLDLMTTFPIGINQGTTGIPSTYGFGWFLNTGGCTKVFNVCRVANDYLHNGWLPGTNGWLQVVSDGTVLAVLANSTSQPLGRSGSDTVVGDLGQVSATIYANVKEWPAYDLFQ